ncbi:MAG TPA: four helix bundle protein [Anaerolineales bacterium]|nr:four helix bundle protein [Anaerolineales bacterium]
MATIARFEDIEAWQTTRELTRQIYDLTRHGEFARDFGLRDQMRRASVSIMSNIAEGFEGRTRHLFIEYLGRAKASAGELRAQLYVAKDINYINQAEFSQLFELCDKSSRQISRFIQYLEQQPNAIREEGIEYNV